MSHEIMAGKRNKEILGILLALVGILFLLVSNHILPFVGWDDIWPLFPLLAGGFLLRLYADQKRTDLLFSGLVFLFLGFFFLLFSTGVLAWGEMLVLWPTFPLIGGISLLAVSSLGKHATAPLVVGIAAILFAVVGYMYVGGVIGGRVTGPFIRLWPLVLIASGLLVFFRARKEVGGWQADEGIKGDSPAGGEGTGFLAESEIIEAVEGAFDSDRAIGELVRKLKEKFPNYTWVGIYRLEKDTLTLHEGHYVGARPEHIKIKVPEGICGYAVKEQKTIIVPDVWKDDRYLACSPFTRSEIVVPIKKGGELLGVLDIDSDDLNAFSEEDRIFLERLVARIVKYL